MDTCSWYKWEALEVARTTKGGVDLKASVRVGESDHAKPDRSMPDYPSSADGVAIDWDAELIAVEYHCSKTQPGMRWGDERLALPLNPGGLISGALESAVRSYLVACHGDVSTGASDEALVKYCYRAATQP